MSHQTWQETLISAKTDGTAVTGTAAASLLPPQAIFTLPANYLDYIGKKIRIRAAGRISNIVTTPGTLTFNLRFGSTPVTVATSGAISLNTTAKTNVTWLLDWALDLRVEGSSAQLIHTGIWSSESVVGSATGIANQVMIPASAPALGTAFSAIAAQSVDLQAQFSLTGNSIQLHQFALESMN